MSEWAQKSISDCAEILDNLRIPVNGETRANNIGSTPYYGANGLQGYIDGHIFDEPLILIAEDGGYFDEYATRSIAYRISGKSWVNNHAHILRPKQELDFDFLFYSLEHKNIIPFIKGGTRAKLNQAELREIKIALPPTKKIQQRIASILINIDTAIKKTESLIAKYQKIKAGLMHDLFTRGVTADGKLRPHREQAPGLYQETPVGWIPMEWDIDQVGERIAIIDPNPSHRYPEQVEEGVPICSTENFDGEDFFLTTKSKLVHEKTSIEQNNRCRFEEKDIVFARKGKIGLARRYGPEKKVFSHTVVLLKPKVKTVNSDWLLWIARSYWLLKTIDVTMNTNSGVPTLGIAFIQQVKIPFPPEWEQAITAQRLDAMACKITSEQNKLEKLKKQKAGLMQDLLTGKVPVKIEPDQEFA